MNSNNLGQVARLPRASRSGGTRTAVRVARLATVTVIAQAMDAAGPRSADARPKGLAYPPKVQAVLEHLDAHPMRLSSIPMIYDSSVSSAHLPAAVQGLTPADVLPPPAQRRGTDPVAAEHFARVVAGLLYAACGGLDQAHNLVTPLCWGAPTPYAGPPIAGSPAAQDAAYVHAITHRAEGHCDGEFGSGFSNANYWYAATGNHAAVYPQVLQSMRRHAAGDPRLEALAANHGDAFSPSRFVAVCSEAARGGDAQLTAWCEKVMGDEMRALLEHAYKRLAAAA